MIKYILKRLCLMLVTFFVIMTICFMLIRLLPNPVPQTKNDQYEIIMQVREAWGYNKPIIIQYGIFLKHVITRFDWGYCTTVGPYLHPVTDYLGDKILPTVLINFGVWIISVPIGILLGIVAAIKKYRWQDKLISGMIIIFISVPGYAYAFLVQYIFGYKLRWFPIIMKAGEDWLSRNMIHSIALPIIALCIPTTAVFMRITRSELIDDINSGYVLYARSKGLSKRQAIIRHAFRNAFVIICPMIINEFIGILVGSIVVERIFAVPGLGDVLIKSVQKRDYSVFLTITMFYNFWTLIAGLLDDICYCIVDPRIHMGGRKANEDR